MWRLKQLMPKDQAGLEGKSVEVGSIKLQVRSVIAEGGFSSVYLARDAQSGKSYALKHLHCSDEDSLHLVRREIAVMKALRGHPNVVMLHASAVIDTGRVKECFLVMDYCDKTLVGVLDSRGGAGFFEERKLLAIFRDVCNAVVAMHCQSPPIAHRDLKAENILLSPDRSWKLCDFGSVSTNHRRFERAEEMGLEEDVIRKHTTPAYRAPEMWDLYRRELISEKVDIWALGCLLYRLAFLRSAFDGESKLQILNGNYRIPEAPRYSDSVTQLIKDMLMPTPESRPDILQVWNRVNDALPSESRKSSPDKVSSAVNSSSLGQQDIPSPETKLTAKTPSPPPAAKNSGGVGSFWSTQFAADSTQDSSSSNPSSGRAAVKNGAAPPGWSADFKRSSPTPTIESSSSSAESRSGSLFKKGGVANVVKKVGSWNRDEGDGDGYAKMSELEEPDRTAPRVSEVSSDGAFNAFVAEFDMVKPGQPRSTDSKTAAELEKLKTELKQALTEKAEFAAKYEKLTAICRSQRQEIQELKSAIAASASSKESVPKPPPVQSAAAAAAAQSRRTRPLNWNSSNEQEIEKDKDRDKQNGSIWDLQSGLSAQPNPQQSPIDAASWSAFGDGFKGSSGKPTTASTPSSSISGAPRRQQHTRAASLSGGDSWGFNSSSSTGLNQHSQQQQKDPKGGFRSTTDSSQQSSRAPAPAGWAGF